MAKDILSMLDDQSLERLTTEIVDTIKDSPKGSRWDTEFQISAGQMTSKSSNTWFMFDVKKGSYLHDFTLALYDREISDNEDKKIGGFVNRLADNIVSHYLLLLRDAIRKKVLPDSDEIVYPLNNIRIDLIDIIDFSSVPEDGKYLTRWRKIPGFSVNMKKVMEFVADAQDDDPDLVIQDIVEREQYKGNDLFDGIIAADRGDKFLYDVTLSLFVDYSPAAPEEILSAIEGKNKVKEE